MSEKPTPYFSNESEFVEVRETSLLVKYLPWFAVGGVVLAISLGVTLYLASVDPIAEPASKCLQALNQEAVLTETLGAPIYLVSDRVDGNFEANGSKAYGLLDKFEVSGPNGNAHVEATMFKRRKNFDWALWKARITFSDGRSILIDKTK